MPICAGRPDNGLCPARKNDSSVTFTICDLFLCKECYDFRKPPTKVGENKRSTPSSKSACTTNPTTTVDTLDLCEAMGTVLLPTRNELLCFVQQKCAVMVLDQLIKLCTDFYRCEEVIAARLALEQCVQHRMPRRQGADASRKAMEDIIKLCLDPNTQLPVYYATDLSRLPPVDATHCDVSALLKELQGLRIEVRELSQLKIEMTQLKAAIPDQSLCKELQTLRAEVTELSGLRKTVDSLQLMISEQSMSLNGWPRLTGSSLESTTTAVSLKSPVKSFANVADDLSRSASTGEQLFASNTSAVKRSANRTKPIVGKLTGTYVSSVNGIRRANVFVTRLSPEATETDIEALVSEILPGCVAMKAERLITRFDTYSSFSLELCVNRSDFDNLLAAVYSENTWPNGIMVRRFFRSKHGEK